MLAMLTLHMQENYSRQSEFDVECQPRHFTLKYGESIQCIKTDCIIEPLNHHDVFKFFQTYVELLVRRMGCCRASLLSAGRVCKFYVRLEVGRGFWSLACCYDTV